MPSSPASLLRRSKLHQNESLPSLLYRLGTLNFYEPATLIFSLCREGVGGASITSIGRPNEVALYRRLAGLTCLDALDLYGATVHRCATILVPPDQEIESLIINDHAVPLLPDKFAARHVFQGRQSQFCPHCLEKSAYHRLIWSLNAATACLEHRCHLIHRCPGCDNLVSIRSIVEATCQLCGGDLTAAESISFAADDFGLYAQEVIQTWLLQGVTPQAISSLLPDHPPRILFRVLCGLLSVVLPIRTDWHYWHPVGEATGVRSQIASRNWIPGLTPAERHRLYTTAFKGLVSWPQGFYAFLRAYLERTERKLTGSLSEDLGILYSSWLARWWQDSAYEFLQDALNEFLVVEYGPTLSVLQSKRYQKNLASENNPCEWRASGVKGWNGTQEPPSRCFHPPVARRNGYKASGQAPSHACWSLPQPPKRALFTLTRLYFLA